MSIVDEVMERTQTVRDGQFSEAHRNRTYIQTLFERALTPEELDEIDFRPSGSSRVGGCVYRVGGVKYYVEAHVGRPGDGAGWITLDGGQRGKRTLWGPQHLREEIVALASTPIT